VTRIDFYILSSDSLDARLRFACRIADKAYQQRQNVVLYAGSPVEAQQLDELLWTYSQSSFVPHRIVRTDPPTPPAEPVLIVHGDPPLELPVDCMINLDTRVPETFSRYLRVAEIVDAEPARREQGRERFRFYRDRGYELKTYDI
jgi:DNA polymerase-3 subunit chi